MLTPCRLKVEYKTNPVGMDEKIPRFSYELTGTSKQQTACRIIVTKEGGETVWDSGFIPSGRSIQIEYRGAPLIPFTRYDWTVEVKDEKGRVSAKCREKAFFETGFLGSKWDAMWISCAWGGSYNPLSRFLRDFTLGKKVKRARLYATALGTYDVFINGTPIGEECLKPGWTDYHERVQYQAFDVTRLLKQGDNTLAAVVADGWYVCKGYGSCPKFRAQLHLEFADGTTQRYVTDKDWKAFYIHIQNPMRMSNIYNGEIYEAWEETDWKMPGGYRVYAVPAHESDPKDPKLKNLHMVWQSGPAIRRMHRMEPVSIVKRPNHTYLVDFGQNFAGREQIRLKNTLQGTTIVIKHGEMLNPDGSLYVENLRNAWQRTVYTCGTHKEEIYEPLYTFAGFRYLEISGWPGKLTKDQICAFSVYSELEQTGTFHCSEPLLNRLYSNIVWGQRSNFVDVPTDCPQRDERQGWTGDTQVFANMATYNMACGDFYTKWLEDLNLAQGPDGAYPYIAPKTGPSRDCMGATGWADAGIVCPMVMFTKYGDTRVIRKYFRNMVAWIDWQIGRAGGSYIVDNAGWGDWLNVDADIDKTYLATVYLGGMTKRLAAMAEVIGETCEANRLACLHEDVKNAFGAKFFGKTGELLVKTQTAAVLALCFRMCPDETARKKTIRYLRHDIKVTRKLHLSTGFLGTPLLLKSLTESGEADLAYDLLLQTTWPGWLYPVTQGATTMWERWNSWTEKDGFCDPEMNSFNHYAYGAVGDWFFETICGIKPVFTSAEDAGFKRFELSPIPGKRLQSAEASYHSSYGLIKSAWKKTKTKWIWDFTVPCNTTAAVVLPDGLKAPAELPAGLTRRDGTIDAAPGEYRIEMDL